MRAFTILIALLVVLGGTAAAQIAQFNFAGNLNSSDTDPTSTTSPATAVLPFIFGGNSTFPNLFCITSAWSSSTPQGPFNNSPAFIEFTVTPEADTIISYTSLTITTWRGGGVQDYVEFAGVYADEDPGPGGNNFQTLVASGDIYPQQTDAGMVTFDLGPALFLWNTTGPVTFRIYFWGNGQAASSNAEIASIVLEGNVSECDDYPATVNSVPCGFSAQLDPVLTVQPIVVGSPLTVDIDTVFPNSPLWIFASVGATQVINAGGCNIVVNPTSMVVLEGLVTDANGDFFFQEPFPVPPVMLGLVINFQARICDVAGLYPGPFAPLPDFFSNGVMATIGCPSTLMLNAGKAASDAGRSVNSTFGWRSTTRTELS